MLVNPYLFRRTCSRGSLSLEAFSAIKKFAILIEVTRRFAAPYFRLHVPWQRIARIIRTNDPERSDAA